DLRFARNGPIVRLMLVSRDCRGISNFLSAGAGMFGILGTDRGRLMHLIRTGGFSIAISIGSLLAGCRPHPSPPPAQKPVAPAVAHPNRAEYERLAREFDAELDKRVLRFWFPRIVDQKRGGFVQTAKSDGTLTDDGSRFLVFQARMTWVAAQIAERH